MGEYSTPKEELRDPNVPPRKISDTEARLQKLEKNIFGDPDVEVSKGLIEQVKELREGKLAKIERFAKMSPYMSGIIASLIIAIVAALFFMLR